jgi:hypothetical protein
MCIGYTPLPKSVIFIFLTLNFIEVVLFIEDGGFQPVAGHSVSKFKKKSIKDIM